jgi:hypothetical protein
MAAAGVGEDWFSPRSVESFTGGIRVILRISRPAASPIAGALAELDAAAAAALLAVQSLDPESQLLSGCVHESPHTHAPHCSQHDTEAPSANTQTACSRARGKVLQHTHAPHA